MPGCGHGRRRRLVHEPHGIGSLDPDGGAFHRFRDGNDGCRPGAPHLDRALFDHFDVLPNTLDEGRQAEQYGQGGPFVLDESVGCLAGNGARDLTDPGTWQHGDSYAEVHVPFGLSP